MDELLTAALAGDLPAEVAAGMRERIDRFRAGTAAGGRAWILRRPVWAALSILMLLAGLLLQGGRASSPLADRIAAIKTANPSFEPPRR